MKKETLNLPEGVTYTGESSDGFPHGKGSATYPDGSTYVGEFKDTKTWKGTEFDKDGNVTVTWSEGIKQ